MTTVDSQSSAEQPAAGLGALKPRLSFVAYHVADIERAIGFYVGVLGFKEQSRFPIGDGVFEAVLGFPDSKGAGLLLMWSEKRSDPYQQGEGYSRLVINVSDVDAAVAHVARHNTPIVSKPRQAGAFYYAMIKDPDGYVIELLQIKQA
jgi:lactoylglutathione lyase